MKNTMKKIITLFVVLILAFSTLSTTAGAIKLGDVIGYAQPTDIIATINGYQIESYNVDGYTYICVEDLRYYGFDVTYNWDNRALYVSRNHSLNKIDPQNTNPNFWYIGNDNTVKNILLTDIGTYANGKYIQSYNINGSTIINFDELSRFGEVYYDDYAREISLYISGIDLNGLIFAAMDYEDFYRDNEYWTFRARAKGDLLMVYATSKDYLSSYECDDIIYNISLEDQEIDSQWVRDFRSVGHTISAIYCEYRNADGSYITSYYAY